MAVPKGKVSKQRRNKRRSSVWKLAAPALVACPKCGALHLPQASKSIVLLYARGRLYYIVLASHVKKRYNELIIMWYYVLLWIRPHFA